MIKEENGSLFAYAWFIRNREPTTIFVGWCCYFHSLIRYKKFQFILQLHKKVKIVPAKFGKKVVHSSDLFIQFYYNIKLSCPWNMYLQYVDQNCAKVCQNILCMQIILSWTICKCSVNIFALYRKNMILSRNFPSILILFKLTNHFYHFV